MHIKKQHIILRVTMDTNDELEGNFTLNIDQDYVTLYSSDMKEVYLNLNHHDLEKIYVMYEKYKKMNEFIKQGENNE